MTSKSKSIIHYDIMTPKIKSWHHKDIWLKLQKYVKKVCNNVKKKYVMLSKVHHDNNMLWHQKVFNYINGTSWHQRLSNDVSLCYESKKYVRCKKVMMLTHAINIIMSWCQKGCCYIKKYVWHQKVQKVWHDVRSPSWHKKVQHDIKSILWHQKVCHDVKSTWGNI